jgi:hypothetical protein
MGVVQNLAPKLQPPHLLLVFGGILAPRNNECSIKTTVRLTLWARSRRQFEVVTN